MTYIQLKCDNCEEIFKYLISEFNPDRLYKCPLRPCGGSLGVYGHKISKPSTIGRKRDFNWTLNRSNMQRPSALIAKAKTRAFFEEAKEEEGKDGDKRLGGRSPKIGLQEKKDEEYVPPVDFDPSMRLTLLDKDERSQEDLRPQTMAYTESKSSGRVDISGSILGERQKNTASLFEGTSAWSHAISWAAPNAGKWYSGSKGHYEYCHLHGDALGGRCLASNLVAGHYALNTYMMVIESQLQSRTDLQIEVTAYCQKTNIADCVHYQIFKKTTSDPQLLWSKFLDGRIQFFSKMDADAVTKDLKEALSKST